MRFNVNNTEKQNQDDITENKNKEKEPFDLKREIFSWVESMIFSLIAVSLIVTVLVRPVRVDGSSMYPTLVNGQILLTTNLSRTYNRNDVVVIRRKNDTALVKRIIAVPGDTIDIDFESGSVYINDKLISEPFINELTTRSLDFEGPVTIPEGYVFVMGDNRNHSDDSRDYKIGLIDMRNIFGKAFFILYPFSDMHKV